MFLVILAFPSYTIATYPEYVESEVMLIKEYMFYTAEETTCMIESYKLVCPDDNSVGGDGSVTVSDTEEKVRYTISTVPGYNTFVYVFTEDELLYTFAGFPLTSNTYEELNVSDLDFESLRHSYSDTTYEPITTLITNHYELNKLFIMGMNVSIFIMSTMFTFAIMLALLTLILTFSSRGAVKAGISEKLKLGNIITIACYSTIIPMMVTILLFLFTGGFTLDLLFLASTIIGILAIRSNGKHLEEQS